MIRPLRTWARGEARSTRGARGARSRRRASAWLRWREAGAARRSATALVTWPSRAAAPQDARLLSQPRTYGEEPPRRRRNARRRARPPPRTRRLHGAFGGGEPTTRERYSNLLAEAARARVSTPFSPRAALSRRAKVERLRAFRAINVSYYEAARSPNGAAATTARGSRDANRCSSARRSCRHNRPHTRHLRRPSKTRWHRTSRSAAAKRASSSLQPGPGAPGVARLPRARLTLASASLGLNSARPSRPHGDPMRIGSDCALDPFLPPTRTSRRAPMNLAASASSAASWWRARRASGGVDGFSLPCSFA